MPNTTLPTNLAPGSPGLISNPNIVHAEINRLSRDTGWQNVRPLLRNGATAAVARIRRQDNLVTFEVLDLNVSAVPGVADGSPVELLTGGTEGTSDISSNFLNAYPVRGNVFKSVGSGFELQLQTNYNAATEAHSISATFYTGRSTGTARLQLMFYCDKPWPTFLP